MKRLFYIIFVLLLTGTAAFCQDAITILPNGNVGIGTTVPSTKLTVDGNTFILGGNSLKFRELNNFIFSPNSNQLGVVTNGVEHIRIDNNGNVGIGTTSPEAKLEVNGDICLEGVNAIYFRTMPNGNYISSPAVGELNFVTNHSEKMRIDKYGQIGIGTTTPEYTLHVHGTFYSTNVHASNMLLKTDSYADFVFDEDYNLRPLEEVKSYIKRYGHLPDIPSEEEIVEKGIDLGEMNTKLLQKIEELTLYLIELKEENERLEERIESLEN